MHTKRNPTNIRNVRRPIDGVQSLINIKMHIKEKFSIECMWKVLSTSLNPYRSDLSQCWKKQSYEVRSDVGRHFGYNEHHWIYTKEKLNIRNVGLPSDFVYTLLNIIEFIMVKNSEKGEKHMKAQYSRHYQIWESVPLLNLYISSFSFIHSS